MKLLLTSSGLMNTSIIRELKRLIGKPMSKVNVAFIPTALNVEEGDKHWFLEDLQDIYKLKPAQVDIVDISALSREVWQKRLQKADVLIFEGGNTFHLINWVRKSGLEKILSKLLKTRVYVGISAGSILVNPRIKLVPEERLESFEPKGSVQEGLGLVSFGIRPHVNRRSFPDMRFSKLKQLAKKTVMPFYAIDDDTAISVDGKKIRVISEGKWKLFNAEKQ